VSTWQELSEESLKAAHALLREGCYRSCISRAYYSAYCAATSLIVKKLTTFPNSWNNPPHQKVPVYIQSNLTITQMKKDEAIKLINILRQFREDADYRPQVTLDEQTARDCVRDAAAIQQELWGIL
jgi:uncharacterized protein (UPF0332 family)